jgi:molybdopterin-guanine dinucleotide biosynthesis protein A
MDGGESVAGVVLAGGRSSRLGGGDKGLRPLAGRPILAHVVERLKPQVSALVINANGDPARFAAFGLRVVADSVPGFAGPLAGVHAGLQWARDHLPAACAVVTVPGDTPFLPGDLVTRFLAARRDHADALLVARSESGVHPVIGLWPVALAAELEESLKRGARKASAWTEAHGAIEVSFPPVEIGGKLIDPFFNINRPEDLARAEAMLR